MASLVQSPAAAALRRSPLAWLGGNTDFVLAALLMAVVALFVLPVPTPLLDLLIATNLAASLVVLIVAMYAPSALSVSTFPSLLLFTTLFRLALNIASTKLILLHADAGAIIDTFGRLIVAGNVVVGAVVFLTIAIVQFIVIAKGSERVAEVAARFALDAMPGKQMSIDADVRAGVLAPAEAQARRRVLEQECQFHGAMDGAMKFVKGDAIAGIVIALVNIGAGIAIGTLMHDMTLVAAIQRFCVLTVGDGMVSQIPSLLVAIAAGVVITRVGDGADRPADTQLAQQIGRQLAAHPRALIVAGAAFASFMLVPGLPLWAFALLAALIVSGGLLARRVLRRRRVAAWITHPAEAGATDAQAGQALAAALAVRLSPAPGEAIDLHRLDQCLERVKGTLEAELGPVVPALRIVAAAGGLPGTYEVTVHDVPAGSGALRPDFRLLVPGAGDVVPAGAELAVPFGPFTGAVWVPAVSGHGLAAEEVVAAHVQAVVRRHAPELIGLQQVQHLLQAVQRDAPDLAAEVARGVPLDRVVDVLRRLLQEGIPIRSLNLILETLVTWAPKEPDPVVLAELVRVALGGYITNRYAGRDRRLAAVLFETAVLDQVLGAVEHGARGNLLLLSPAMARDIRDQVRRIVEGADAAAVAVTSMEARRYVKTLLEPVLPHLAVVSYQEIAADVVLEPLGWVAATPGAAA